MRKGIVIGAAELLLSGGLIKKCVEPYRADLVRALFVPKYADSRQEFGAARANVKP